MNELGTLSPEQEELAARLREGFEVDGFYSPPGEGTSFTPNWERTDYSGQLGFVSAAILYRERGGTLDEDQVESLVKGLGTLRGSTRYWLRQSPAGDTYYEARLAEIDEALATLKPTEVE